MLQNSYRLSINNLALINSNYPFDFFLRIKEPQRKGYQDSPTVNAQLFQCDQDFPWEFQVESMNIIIEFIEISPKNGAQIIKASYQMEKETDQDGMEIIMLANRTGKKLCVLDYTLFLNEEDRASNQGFRQNSVKQKRGQSRTNREKQEEEARQNSERIEKKIQNLNKSIQKILQHEKSEHKMFSQYLDQSNTFLQQILKEKNKSICQNNKSNDNHSNILQPLQNEQEEGDDAQAPLIDQNQMSSNKWYQSKFGKQKPNISKNVNYRKIGNLKIEKKNKLPECTLQYSQDTVQQNKTYILDGISFNNQHPISEINFYKEKKEIPKEKQQQNLQEKKNKNKEANKEQQKPLLKVTLQKPHYDLNKQIELVQAEFYVVQTLSQGRKECLSGCLAPNELQQEKMLLYDENGVLKGVMKFKFKKVGVFIVQTEDVLQDPSQYRKNQEGQKLDQIDNEAQIKQDKQKKQKKQQEVKRKKEEYEREKYLKEQQQRNKERQIQKRKEQSQQVFKVEKSRQPEKNRNEIKRRQQKEQIPQKNSYDIVSNSVCYSYLPFMRKRLSLSQKPKRSAFLSEEEEDQKSQLNSNFQKTKTVGNQKFVNLKIDSMNVQLHGDFDQFTGKFLRLYMKDRDPYITETINLSKNLKWKGKGYIFDKVSQFSELLVQLCVQKNQETIVEGSAKICLALLFLNKPNHLQFYHQYIRDILQNTIGELVIGYENIVRNDHSRSVSNHKIEDKNNQQFSPVLLMRKKKTKKSSVAKSNAFRIGAESYLKPKYSNVEIKDKKKSKQKNVYGSGSGSMIRSKKYTGGNIIIGRAARFRRIQTDNNDPGPGDYQMPSSFERHASPF